MPDYICRYQKESKLPESDNLEEKYFRRIQKEVNGTKEITLPYLCEKTNKMCIGYESPEMMPEIEIMRRCPSFISVSRKKLREQVKRERIEGLCMITGATLEEIKSLEGKNNEEQWNVLSEIMARTDEEASKMIIRT